MHRRLLPSAVIALALLSRSGTAFAQVDEQSELDKARNAYLAHQYEEADVRFRALLDARNPVLHDRVLVNQAHMYWGAVMQARKHAEQANAQFEELLLSDPTYEPDPLAFPTDVVNAFIDTRSRLRERLTRIAHDKAVTAAIKQKQDEQNRLAQETRLKLLEKLATQEKTVARHSRWIALLPFGAGQFQNGQKPLGWAFLGTEAALVAAAVITLPVYLVALENESNAYSQGDSFRSGEYHDRAVEIRYANIGLNIALAGVAAVGIIQAQAAFVPEEAELIKRPVPEIVPASHLSFDLSPIRPAEGKGGGMTFGIRGRF